VANFIIEQGVEMGRPSEITVQAAKTDGVVREAWVEGRCVMVMQGSIET